MFQEEAWQVLNFFGGWGNDSELGFLAAEGDYSAWEEEGGWSLRQVGFRGF